MNAAVRLQFVLGTGWSSRLIAWYGQGSNGYSHVDAVLPDGTLLGARYDAVGGKPPGVWIRKPGYERWLRRTVVELPTTELKAITWERLLRRREGAQYDPEAILGFLLGYNAHQQGHWICSALQVEGLRQVHLLHAGATPAHQITPNTLFELVTTGLGGQVLEHASG